MKEEERGQRPTTALRLLAVCLAAAGLLSLAPAPAAAAGPGEAALEAWSLGGGAQPSAETVRTVIPLGRAVGIELFSDGVLVVGLSEISTQQGAQAPAKDCGLQEGDIITHINSEEVDTIEEVREILQEVGDHQMSIRCLRGEKQLQMTVQAVQCSTDGAYKLGAWIRDSMAGIGTMTFYDPDSGVFGALGHGISDVDTAQLMPLSSGSIMYAEVTDVKKGESGNPGELHGAFQVSQDMGSLYANTQRGVFGYLTDQCLTQGIEPVELAAREQVQVGEATILSNIAGDQVEEYTVEITHIYPENDDDPRNMMIKVTDPRLLEATGGIVQGMSGSPILQNGRLVGAVTHVLVNDPTQGYGILAENMLDAAEQQSRGS